MAIIIPGILTRDEEEYHKKLLMAEHVSDLIQIDLVDGKFSANVTVGVDIIKKYLSSSQLEIQLMVVYPQNYIDDLINLDYVSRIIFPFEINGGHNEIIYHVRNHSKQVGLSLNPETPLKAALHFFDDIDLLELMAGNPGFSGQKFQEHVIDKIKEVKRLAPELSVEVDIGVNFETAPRIARAGADFLVASSVLYNAPDFQVAFEKLAKLVQIRNN